MLKKLLGITAIMLLFSGTCYARELYVDCVNGHDTNSGSSAEPFATIQQAADTVRPGDTVVVRPGVYYGPINITTPGTQESPIVFYAEKSGENETIITNANKRVREGGNDLWTCVDSAKNIWAIDYVVEKNAHIDLVEPDWLAPARVLCDDIDLMAYTDFNALNGGVFHVMEEGYLPSYPQGYYYDITAKRLYVRLRTDGKYGASNPNEHTMKVAPSIYTYISVSGGWGGGAWRGNAMGRDSYNVCVGNYNGPLSEVEERAPSYYVTLDGFTMETPGFSGVFLRASDVTIKNCWFRGCRTGVRGAARLRYNDLMYSDTVTIEHCDYSQYPTYDDAADLISYYYTNQLMDSQYTAPTGRSYDLYTYFWWQRKGYNKNFDYESGGFTNFMGEHWTIRYNYIHDSFDAFSYQSMQRYAADNLEVGAQYIEIYGNRFEKCLDNAIEFENHAKDVNVFENEFHNVFVPLSWQPLNGTPWPTNIRIYKNIIHNTRDFNSFWKEQAGFEVYAFKIGANKSNWKDYPWMDDSDWNTTYDVPNGNVAATEEGVSIFNNTVIMPSAKLLSNVGGKNMSMVPFYNFRFMNNAIVCDVRVISQTEEGVQKGYLAYPKSGIDFSHNIFAPDTGVSFQILDEALTNGKYIDSAEKMGFELISRLRLDPTLRANSPLRNAGMKDRHEPQMTTDVGAVSFGTTFQDYNAGCIIR